MRYSSAPASLNDHLADDLDGSKSIFEHLLTSHIRTDAVKLTPDQQREIHQKIHSGDFEYLEDHRTMVLTRENGAKSNFDLFCNTCKIFSSIASLDIEFAKRAAQKHTEAFRPLTTEEVFARL